MSEEEIPGTPSTTDRVAELYRAGFNAGQIAKRLGLSLAEVQLLFVYLGLDEDLEGIVCQ
jgi:hypothetical protein